MRFVIVTGVSGAGKSTVLKMLEDASGITLSGSPTQKVSGEILDGLTEVEHTRPMLSAAKTKSVDEIVRFISSHAALVSWKLGV